MCNVLGMPRRTRASGVVVWDDRDAGDATVLESGFGDHGCFCSRFDGEWESRAGKTLRAVASYINFKGVVNVSGQVRQSRAPGLMRLCDQDDTIHHVRLCQRGMFLCNIYLTCILCPVTSSAFTYNRVMQVARGSCSAEA